MGNCQAIDAATLVIQHPSGKIERYYSPVSASHVMKTNPGHYVALLISTTTTTTLCPTNKDTENCPNNKSDTKNNTNSTNPIRLTRIKLLKPTDTLLLGHVYRLITTQGVYLFLFPNFHAFMYGFKLQCVSKTVLRLHWMHLSTILCNIKGCV